MIALLDNEGKVCTTYSDEAKIPLGLLKRYRAVELVVCPVCHGDKYILSDAHKELVKK